MLVAAFLVREASRGEGAVHRFAQSIWCRIGSMDRFHKSEMRHNSLRAIVATAQQPFVERVTRRYLPELSGWLAAFPTDKGSAHDYLGLYDQLLAPYRDLPDARILEIGVNKGGSLALWREYFAASATIFGVDVNPGVQTFPADAGIKVVIVDSRDAREVNAAFSGTKFDVIIDDGLHTPDAQARTFEAFRPLLKTTGIYVLEDVSECDPARFAAFGDVATRFPGATGQSLVVLRPVDSHAGPLSPLRTAVA